MKSISSKQKFKRQINRVAVCKGRFFKMKRTRIQKVIGLAFLMLATVFLLYFFRGGLGRASQPSNLPSPNFSGPEGSSRGDRGSGGSSARRKSISLTEQFEDSLENGNPEAVKKLLPQVHEDQLLTSLPLYGRFLRAVAHYSPKELAAVLSLWPPERPLRTEGGGWVPVPSRYDVAQHLWNKSISNSVPKDQQFDKALEVIKNFKPDNYVRRQWMKRMLSETQGFSMAHLKELQKLQLSKEDKKALYNILINGADNLDEELYGKSYEELGLDW
jgi:hypothetical protein